METLNKSNRNPLSPPRGLCGSRLPSRPSYGAPKHVPAARGNTQQSHGVGCDTRDDGAPDPLRTLLSAETEETIAPAPLLQSQPPRCGCLTLHGWLVVMWLIMTLCFIGVVLYVNLHNMRVARALVEHMTAAGMSESDVHKTVRTHRARNVLVIVSVVCVVLYALGSIEFCECGGLFSAALLSDMHSTLTYFENAACLRLETVPTCVCEAREMNCVTERMQRFTLIPFSEFDRARRAQIWMSEASVLIREFCSTLPPEVYDELFSPDEKPDNQLSASVHGDSQNEEIQRSPNNTPRCDEAPSDLTRAFGDNNSSHGRGSAGDEVSLSATNRTVNSLSMHFSASATSSTARRDYWRVSGLPRSMTKKDTSSLPQGGTRSLENSLSTTQARANFLEKVRLGLKRRRATVLVVHFAGFQSVANTSSKDAKKMSEFFLKLVVRLAKPYECSVAQCRADRITLCWNTFGRQHDRDHELLALQCGQQLSQIVQEELRKHFWRFNIDEQFSMRTVVVGFTAPVLAGLVGPNRSVRIVYGNYISLCSELLNLLVYEGSRFAWIDDPPRSLKAPPTPTLEDESAHPDSSAGATTTTPPEPRRKPWTAVPFDTVEDELGYAHRLYEISQQYTHDMAHAHEQAYHTFAQGNFGESMRLFMRLAPEENASEASANPIAARLRQLSVYYVLLNNPTVRHVRPYPAWEVVPGDVLDNGTAAPTTTTAETALSTANEKEAATDHTTSNSAVVEKAVSRVLPRRSTRSRRSDVEELREAIEIVAKGRHHESEPQGLTTPRDEVRLVDSIDAGSPTNASVPVAPGSSVLSSDAFSPITTALPPSHHGATVPPTPMDGACGVVAASSEVDYRPHIACELVDKKNLHFLLSQRRLGETNSSEVFLGLSFTGQQVAIKSIRLIIDSGDAKPMTAVNRRRAARKGHVPLSNTTIDIDEVTREVQVLSTIRHDYIVGYITSIVSKGHLLIIMEYVSGGSLRHVLRDFKPSTEQSRTYLKEILRGLHHLHKKNIVHCDIKPENVLVSISGSCKLTDFGISRQISKASSAVRAEGTPCYMAPEAADGNAVLKSDIWSFGIMMIELLTGRRPWAKELHPLAMRAQLRQGTIEPAIQGEVSEEVRHIFSLCTKREPEARPSAEDLLRMPFFTLRGRSSSLRRSKSSQHGSISSIPGPQTTDHSAVIPAAVEPEL